VGHHLGSGDEDARTGDLRESSPADVFRQPHALLIDKEPRQLDRPGTTTQHLFGQRLRRQNTCSLSTPGPHVCASRSRTGRLVRRPPNQTLPRFS